MPCSRGYQSPISQYIFQDWLGCFGTCQWGIYLKWLGSAYLVPAPVLGLGRWYNVTVLARSNELRAVYLDLWVCRYCFEPWVYVLLWLLGVLCLFALTLVRHALWLFGSLVLCVGWVSSFGQGFLGRIYRRLWLLGCLVPMCIWGSILGVVLTTTS